MLLSRINLFPLLAFASLSAYAANTSGLGAPYPEADSGYTRYAVHLPPLADEYEARIEIQVGKTLEVDCNIHRFHATLKEHTLQGWGYPYYHIENIKGPVSTLKACPEQSKTRQFVAAGGDGFLLRYNSKLPVVVYVPSGFELRYRVWHASPDFQDAQPE
ncbi:ecotin [Methylobacillus rhizosphaerae]|uniref:Ecotin n=1 Tax=Methylobacillus rhizosphaerae TaxID=551994 RepID=A0A239B5D7_9PROT|nr:serine protease inhibitor ecotin [Methylobacillus rhizosphaerae]SNS03019.1 ecotin [Methylobacillus rhizosphaerae]